MSHNATTRQLILCLVVSLFTRNVKNDCLLSNGITFKQFQSKAINVKPIETMQIMHEFECQIQCKVNSKCQSLNIKQVGEHLLCELLAVNSNDAVIERDTSSTYYEYINTLELASDPYYIKTYCEPECRYDGPCTETSPKCICDKGSIQSLHRGSVMVGAKDNKFAKIKVDVPTGKYKIKLVHRYGYISCVPGFNYLTYLGCWTSSKDSIEMIVTHRNNSRLLPGSSGSTHDGMRSRSTFVTFNDPVYLTRGEELRIWYFEDLAANALEADNFGSVFINVLAINQN